jgi:hypothetical protein
VNPGTVEIEAVVYYGEELRNNGTEKYFKYQLEDALGNQFMELGGWNELNSSGEAKAKPNGVHFAEFTWLKNLTDEQLTSIKANFDFTGVNGFDWSEVGFLRTKTSRDDDDGDGVYDEERTINFVKVDTNGRHDWDCFNVKVEGAVTSIKDGQWNTLSASVDLNASTLMPLAEFIGADQEVIMSTIMTNHGEAIQAKVPYFNDLSFYVGQVEKDLFVAN